MAPDSGDSALPKRDVLVRPFPGACQAGPVRETLRPVAGAFVAFGVFWGSWAVAATDVERSLHLSHAGLGLLLSVSVGAGGVAAAASGGLAERWGTARTLAWAMVLWGAVSAAATISAGRVLFVAAFVLAMVSAGLVDMAMNAAAAAGLRGDAGRMVRFHALFNGGALVGAAATGTLLHAGLSWRWTWGGVGLVAIGLSLLTRSARLAGATPRPPEPEGLDSAVPAATTSPKESGTGHSLLRSFAAVRAEHLVVLAFAFAVTAVVEGGIDTWGVLFLRTHLAAGVLLGAGAYAVGQGIAVATRGAGGPLIGRVGARWGLVLGAGVATIGLGLEAASTQAATAAVGLALAAGGISLCWPLVMAVLSGIGHAGPIEGQPPRSSAALVGAFTAAGYLGWVVGPAVVGTIADSAGLAAGLLVLAGLAATAAVTLAAVPARPRPG